MPEKGEGILSLTSLGEVEGAAEEEAMLSELEGPKFNHEKRSRREFQSLGLGLKWKESDKGLVSPMVLIQIIHWGLLSVCLFIHFVRILFCYDFKQLIVIPTINNTVSFGYTRVLMNSGRVFSRKCKRMFAVFSRVFYSTLCKVLI